MDDQLPETTGSSRRGPWWVVVSAFAGASAALALPGSTGDLAAVASVLAVGALALLAGHTWGLLVVAVADVMLLGQVWPMLAFESDGATQLAAATALVSALPGLALLGIAFPALVSVIFGEQTSDRVRSAGVATCAIGAALAVVLPAL